MSLLLHLSPDLEAQVREAARAKGIDPGDVVEQVLKTYLPTISRVSPKNGDALVSPDPELVAKVKSLRGKFAHTLTGSAIEALHRERQKDKEREEHRVLGHKA
jgi:hypothetical protein